MIFSFIFYSFADAPPSYQSIFGQMKDAKKSSSSPMDFVKKLITLLLNTSESQYVMWSSKIGRKSEILILRYSQTKDIFSFVSFCFGNSLIADIFWTGCSISIWFSAKCRFANACYNPIRNWKLNMTDFRLILLDHTTYGIISLKVTFMPPSPISGAIIWGESENKFSQRFSQRFSPAICKNPSRFS